MRVIITNLYSDLHRLYEGDGPTIEKQLLFDYPFLRMTGAEEKPHLNDLLELLASHQAYWVEVEDEGNLNKGETGDSTSFVNSSVAHDMMGFSPHAEQPFEAAKFLAGGISITEEDARKALLEADGDVEMAALLAYRLPTDESNLNALRAIVAMGEFGKADPTPEVAKKAIALFDSGKDVAKAITDAYTDAFVFPLKLGGKHSKGVLIARDQNTKKSYILKPGSGKQSPAAGAREELANQSRREAAFYHIAKEWGLFDFIPRCELINIEGIEYAAIQLLPWDYKTLDKEKRNDHGLPRRVLLPYLKDGALHKWATMDFVMGNPDRHGQNLMVNPEGRVELIDHGSAFAGKDFDPANDEDSFIPYYLRAWAIDSFSALSPEEKLSMTPRVSTQVAKTLEKWVFDIKESTVEAICSSYGINPQPTLDRLAIVKREVLSRPLDEAINELWVGGWKTRRA